MNLQDFYDGRAFDAYEFFGAHIENKKVVFRTYAPQAREIFVIGEFNDWRGDKMIQEQSSGVWTFISDKAKEGMMYKYCIHGADGSVVDHCDPYGYRMELRPASASIITDLKKYKFSDSKWMQTRDKNYNKPLNIYEVHFGSWHTNAKDENGWYTYDEMADSLIKYVKENNFTHIEFMPLSEHPADCSWGYQNTGFYSPTSRYGTPLQLMKLIDKCHQADIGVILDFVMVHFAVDSYGLASYDGTFLYDLPRNDTGVSEWGTINFNHSRRETACFIQSCAMYWLKEYHFDGIRMDAISRAIYWMGDPARGVNDRAVEFIKTMNEGLQKRMPSAMLIAEDSTSYPKVTAPVEYDGLGFDYKWDLGWMNDTLEFFKVPPEYRPDHYYELVFSMQYFFSEHFILPFSHDEVVHSKATIIQKMWGDYEVKFPQARALFLYMFAHPGKKLNFMGNELAQFREWDEKREQDWDILKYPLHDSFHKYFAELSRLYVTQKALHQEEYSNYNFKWLVSEDPNRTVYIFEVGQGDEKIIAAFNLSANDYKEYEFFADSDCSLSELISSDYDIYSGTTQKGTQIIKRKYDESTDLTSLSIHLPAFTGILYKKIKA
ncbi:MAG: 1,4-alpha-glucan branching protein GlgB [Oscillospiraceae bacterium]|nr:1,4-alpha-glucan branching protein GlgB [Oscillospiraceae bacterium]